MGRGRDYDGSAFPFFALTLMSLYIIPSTWYSVRRLGSACCSRSGAASPEALKRARSGAERAKLKLQAKKSSGWRGAMSFGFVLNLLVLSVLLYFAGNLIVQVREQAGSIKSWDPYEVLGIETGASGAQIKRAYRQMSLKYHPDKNPDDPEAAEKFLGVTRAHSVLTDEAARENYERYGNPEGRQAMEVAIGLPEILATEQGRKTMLVIYLGVLIIGMPLFVWTWYSRSQKYSASGLLNETEANIRRRYYLYRARGHKFPSEPPVVKVEEVPQEISCAKEFESPSSLQLRPADALQQLQKKLAQDGVPGAELSRRFTGSTKKVKKGRARALHPLVVQRMSAHAELMSFLAFARSGDDPGRASWAPRRKKGASGASDAAPASFASPAALQILTMANPVLDTSLTYASAGGLRDIRNAFAILEAWARLTQALWVFDVRKAARAGSRKGKAASKADSVVKVDQQHHCSLLQLPGVKEEDLRHFPPGMTLRSFLEPQEPKGPFQHEGARAEKEADRLAERDSRGLPDELREEGASLIREVYLTQPKGRARTEEETAALTRGTALALEALPEWLRSDASEEGRARRARVIQAVATLPRHFGDTLRAEVAAVAAELPLIYFDARIDEHRYTGPGAGEFEDDGEGDISDVSDDEDDSPASDEEDTAVYSSDDSGAEDAAKKGGVDDEGAAEESKGGEAAASTTSGDGEAKLRVGQLLTCEVALRRDAYLPATLKELPPVYCPLWTESRTESWWIFVVYSNMILSFKRIDDWGVGEHTARLDLDTSQLHYAAMRELARKARRDGKKKAGIRESLAAKGPSEDRAVTYDLKVYVRTNAYLGIEPQPVPVSVTLYGAEQKENGDAARRGAPTSMDDPDAYVSSDDETFTADGGAAAPQTSATGHEYSTAQLRRRRARQTRGAAGAADGNESSGSSEGGEGLEDSEADSVTGDEGEFE